MYRNAARFAGLLLVLATLGGGAGIARGEDPPDGDEPEKTEESPRDLLDRDGGTPRFRLHGFADVNAFLERQNPDPEDGTANGFFALGELDLYITSALTDSISFLGEIAFEVEEEGRSVVDIERLFLKYTLSDRLWFSFGRRHTALGYWNETFHHGLLLQPTIERPLALRFEDDGGVLPVHTVGVGLGGRWFRSLWMLDYVTMIGNGRGKTVHEVQALSDENDDKSVALKLSLTRHKASRLQFGPMIYLDVIPADPTVPERAGEIRERILGAHVRFRNERFELISEYYNIWHDDEVSGLEFEHPTYYAIAIWRPWSWKPYVGFDRLDLEEGDPYFAGIDRTTRYLVGTRWDLNRFHALKFEYRLDKLSGVDIHGLAIQAAFSF